MAQNYPLSLYLSLNLDAIPQTIKETQLLRELGSLFSKTREAARLYLALGGDRSLTWADDTPVAKILKDLKEKAMDLVNGELKELFQKNKKDQRVSLDISTYYLENYNETRMIVTAVVGGYYALDLADLDKFRKGTKKPAVYNFVKLVMIALHRFVPTYSLSNFYEWRGDMFEEMVGEEEPETIDTMKKELEGYDNFVESNKLTGKKFIDELDLACKKARRHLGNKERAWADMAVMMVKYFAGRKNVGIVPIVRNDEDPIGDPVLGLEMFFCLLWNSQGITSTYMIEDLNSNAGEYGPPIVRFEIRSQRDVVAVRKFIEHLMMLEIVMFDASRLFKL